MNEHPRLLRLRYPAVCGTCGAALERGSQAWWDSRAKRATCTDHASDEAPPTERVEDTTSEAELVPPQVEHGIAGASAQREMDRRQEKREARIRGRFGRLGGLVLALTDDPQSTQAWGKGAEGERKVGSLLAQWFSEDGEGVVLHDRRIPGSRANIDHIVIASAGIFVIDPKKYTGRITKRDVGGLFKKDERLFVGSRDCSHLVEGVQRQVDIVQGMLTREGLPAETPVTGILCFVDAEWSLFAKTFQVGRVTVAWPKALRAPLTATRVLNTTQQAAIASMLSKALPSA